MNVISELNNAGTEAAVMNYYRNMDRDIVQQDFLVLSTGKGYYEEEITGLGGRIYKIPAFTKDPIRCSVLRKKFFREHIYDIIEIHSPTICRYAYCKLAKKHGAKVIYHIHNAIPAPKWIEKHAQKSLRKYADRIVACSEYAGKIALGTDEKITVVRNAIDFKKYVFQSHVREDLRAFYRIEESDFVYGTVGRFSEVKNQKFLIHAFSLAYKKNKHLRLILKGFGELKNDLEQYVAASGLQNVVIFAKDDHTANSLYNMMDAFVLPSLYEGLPVVAVEAQANGLPVLASSNITREIALSEQVRFLDLDLSLWEKALSEGADVLLRQTVEQDHWKKTGYDIEQESINRQKEFLLMCKQRNDK